MPRVILKQTEYKLTDFCDFVRCEMKRQKISQKEMAEHLDIDQSVLSRHLENGSFNLFQILKMFEKLKPQDGQIVRLFK